MSLTQLLPDIRALARVEKFQLIKMLAEDLACAEASSLLKPGASYPLWSPDQSYEAADTLLRVLQAEKGKP